MQKCFSLLGGLLYKQNFSGQILRTQVNIYSISAKFCSHAADDVQNYQRLKEVAFKRPIYNVNEFFEEIKRDRDVCFKDIRKVFHTINFSGLKKEYVLLLFELCGSTVPDSSRKDRNKFCHEIYSNLQEANKLDLNIYHAYLKTCNENNVSINWKYFLTTLKCKPDKKTYKLLFENVCQTGKNSDALLMLEFMKYEKISLDPYIFDNLVLSHSIEGGLKLAENVLNTMRFAHMPETNRTKLAIFRGLIKRKDFNDFKKAVEVYPVGLEEADFLMLLEELGLTGSESWLSEMKPLYQDIPVTRELEAKITQICIHLIHMGQPESAMAIFKMFVKPIPETFYGFSLLQEMLHCNIDIHVIISLSKSLNESGLSEYLLEKLTKVALRFKYCDQAWALLGSLETLRCHYFWPLFVHKGTTEGENGVYGVLKNMLNFGMKPDCETLEQYFYPYYEVPQHGKNLKLLLIKLRNEGFSVRELLSPLLMYLLQQKKPRLAANFCSDYNVRIFGERFLELFPQTWFSTKDANSILSLLQKYCESNITEQDLVGAFLISCCKMCKTDDDFKDFLFLVKMVHEKSLKISCASGERLQELIDSCLKDTTRSNLNFLITSILDLGLKFSENVDIPHPRDMDINGLECHLIELQEKNMNTRGVVRKLIQLHTSQGNRKRVQELREKFLGSRYKESPGIKSSVMHNCVMEGQLDEALNLYDELKMSYPKFNLDSFKFMDLAKLLIENDRFEEGFDILEKEIMNRKVSHATGGIQRNCMLLLSSCKNEEQLTKVFTLLLTNELCEPSNVILGPLVKLHLKSGDLTKAVETYVTLCAKYKRTPLQLEMLCAVLKSGNTEIVRKVFKATENVHGHGPAQVGFIAALAENGQEKALTNALSRLTVSIKPLLEKRYRRWVEEKKIEPLKCMARSCERLQSDIFNFSLIYQCIFDIYDLNNDYAGALSFYQSLPEELIEKLNLENNFNRLSQKTSYK